MSLKLEREGRFRAHAVSWNVRTTQNSQSVGINVLFRVLECYDPATGEWADWREYEETTVYGTFFVVKKDGSVNTTPLNQLCDSGLFDGRGDLLLRVANESPPDLPVQITVKADTYEGRTTYKVQWLNAGDADPTPQGGASFDEVKQLNMRFGSLLRAATGARQKAASGNGGQRRGAAGAPPPRAPAPAPGCLTDEDFYAFPQQPDVAGAAAAEDPGGR